jgi:hypothetical protein
MVATTPQEQHVAVLIPSKEKKCCSFVKQIKILLLIYHQKPIKYEQQKDST